jgi:hypothetical protein
MTRIAKCECPPVQFEANGHTYNYGYYLADGIYPRWQTIVKPVKYPTGKKKLQFHNAQATPRKDVERAFGILQTQFAIVRRPARFLDQNILWYIITACVIMHSMIIEEERDQELNYTHYDLMGVPVKCVEEKRDWPNLFSHTMPFVKEKCMINFNLISSSGGGSGMGNNE